MPVGNWGGYVLAGGQSSRMGSDKALLTVLGKPLVVRAAETIAAAGIEATIVGHGRYSEFGYRVIRDQFELAGPLAGIHAALQDSPYGWNVVLACDMPYVTAEHLMQLREAASDCFQNAVIPVGADARPQPLCAAYHRRALIGIEKALLSSTRKVIRAFTPEEILLFHWPNPKPAEPDPFRNVNTPEDWKSLAPADLR